MIRPTFGGYVHANLLAVVQALQLSQDDIYILGKSSFMASFVGNAEKRRLCAAFDTYWEASERWAVPQ